MVYHQPFWNVSIDFTDGLTVILKIIRCDLRHYHVTDKNNAVGFEGLDIYYQYMYM